MPLIINSPKSIFHLCGGLGAQHPSFIFVVDVGYKQCATPVQNVVIGRMHSATTRKLKAQVAKTLNKKVHRPVVAIANRQDRRMQVGIRHPDHREDAAMRLWG